KPEEAGLALDVPGTLDRPAGFTLDPVRIWQNLTGSVERQVATTVDETRLTAAVAAHAREAEVAPKDGSVSFADGTATGVAAVTGGTGAVEPLARQLAAAYPRASAITAEVMLTPPTVTQEAVDSALDSFARPLMAAPVTLMAGPATASVTPGQLAAGLSMDPNTEGRLNPVVDRVKLAALATQALGGALQPSQDARIVVEDDVPKVLSSVDGVTVDPATSADVLVAALTATDRTAQLAVSTAPP